METYTADRIVTINVDVQKDFCPGGSLAVEDGDKVVIPLNDMNDFTRANGGTVVFTGDQHPKKTKHFDDWGAHCVAGTDGATFHPDLIVEPGDIIVDKGMGQEDGYSAFEGIAHDGRTLAEIITPVGRERLAVLLGGLATNFCVLKTAIDATQVNPGDGEIEIFLSREAIRGIDFQPGDSEAAIQEMARLGITIVDDINEIFNGNIIKLAA